MSNVQGSWAEFSKGGRPQLSRQLSWQETISKRLQIWKASQVPEIMYPHQAEQQARSRASPAVVEFYMYEYTVSYHLRYIDTVYE